MITKDIAASLRIGHVLYAVSERNADKTPLRVRVTGKCQTWVRQPQKFRLPVRHGLKSNGYISELNGHEWAITEAAAVMENTGNSKTFIPRKVMSIAHVMTRNEWNTAKRQDYLIPGIDGTGFWVRGDMEVEHVTRPRPPGATHVAWYNK